MRYQNIFLLLGTNLGDRLGNLSRSLDLIQSQLGPVTKKSSIYETAPWGKTDQPNYLNQAVQLETNLTSTDLLSGCLTIEKDMGRLREEKWGARLIDIDIIYFDDQVINSNGLIIPHPRMAERKFVLAPLAEIEPNFVHPILKKTNSDLLMDCSDQLSIKVFSR